ncbi:hypothetical protein L2E82_50947 [Cichorium intybus]|nr:hypothetical protein L2E82_50947 [Cichorium intybus]
MRYQSGDTVIEVDQSLNKRSRSVMGSEIYISDEGEASENGSMEMIEVSENSGDEGYESKHEAYCSDEEYESDHEAYNSTVIESPGEKTKLWQPVLPKENM